MVVEGGREEGTIARRSKDFSALSCRGSLVRVLASRDGAKFQLARLVLQLERSHNN